MHYHYPTPAELGIGIPPGLREDRFNAGLRLALLGGRLDRIEHLRLSFRLGFRAAKLYLKELRRSRGVIEFPQRWRLRLAARWDGVPDTAGRAAAVRRPAAAGRPRKAVRRPDSAAGQSPR